MKIQGMKIQANLTKIFPNSINFAEKMLLAEAIASSAPTAQLLLLYFYVYHQISCFFYFDYLDTKLLSTQKFSDLQFC